MDITDLHTSSKAEEGPISFSGRGDFPCKLPLHQSYKAMKEASILKVNISFLYIVHAFVTELSVSNLCHVIIPCRVWGVRYDFCMGVKGLETYSNVYNAKYQVNQSNNL